MKKITSAYANKWLKSLEEDKEYWINKEEASSTYVAAINEEPVIPEYDYAEVAATIAEIDEKIAVIKCNRKSAGKGYRDERGHDLNKDGAVE